jgi:hypothetical protein
MQGLEHSVSKSLAMLKIGFCEEDERGISGQRRTLLPTNSHPDSLYTSIREMGVQCRFPEKKTLGSSRIAQEIYQKVDEIIAVLGTTYNMSEISQVPDKARAL